MANIKKLFLITLFLSVSSAAQVSYIDYLSPFHPTIGQSGMVVSQSQASSDIGIQVLEMGGNAYAKIDWEKRNL